MYRKNYVCGWESTSTIPKISICSYVKSYCPILLKYVRGMEVEEDWEIWRQRNECYERFH
jgi:hypothetical protein